MVGAVGHTHSRVGLVTHEVHVGGPVGAPAVVDVRQRRGDPGDCSFGRGNQASATRRTRHSELVRSERVASLYRDACFHAQAAAQRRLRCTPTRVFESLDSDSEMRPVDCWAWKLVGGPVPEESTTPEQEAVVLSSFQNRRAAERMVASLERAFRSGWAARVVVPQKPGVNTPAQTVRANATR